MKLPVNRMRGRLPSVNPFFLLENIPWTCTKEGESEMLEIYRISIILIF